MIQEIKKDANLAWNEELISIKVKLSKNKQVSFFRICLGFFMHFINKVFFVFLILMDQKHKKTFVMTEKRKEAFRKMIEN